MRLLSIFLIIAILALAPIGLAEEFPSAYLQSINEPAGGSAVDFMPTPAPTVQANTAAVQSPSYSGTGSSSGSSYYATSAYPQYYSPYYSYYSPYYSYNYPYYTNFHAYSYPLNGYYYDAYYSSANSYFNNYYYPVYYPSYYRSGIYVSYATSGPSSSYYARITYSSDEPADPPAAEPAVNPPAQEQAPQQPNAKVAWMRR
jgi:hypothetical protein